MKEAGGEPRELALLAEVSEVVKSLQMSHHSSSPFRPLSSKRHNRYIPRIIIDPEFLHVSSEAQSRTGLQQLVIIEQNASLRIIVNAA